MNYLAVILLLAGLSLILGTLWAITWYDKKVSEERARSLNLSLILTRGQVRDLSREIDIIKSAMDLKTKALELINKWDDREGSAWSECSERVADIIVEFYSNNISEHDYKLNFLKSIGEDKI